VAEPATTTFVSDLLPYPRVKVASLSDLSSGAFNAAYPDKTSLIQLIKLGEKAVGGVGPDEDIVAYSGLCSHMGCPLVYDAEQKILQCPCHYSHFDAAADAMLINGPATQHLPRITLEVDGQDVYAVGVQGLIYGRPHNLSLTEL
jgi:arsenite oxidase small subunit